jgi:hypothetical protein
MSKKILTAGVPTPSVGKSCSKSRVNGSGICGSVWVRKCKKCSCATSNGHLRKNRLPVLRRWKTSRKSMAPGSGLRHSDEPRGGSELMPSPVPGGWQTPLSSRSQPVVERSASRECVYPTAVYLAYQTDCQRCALREQCLASGAKGDRARRVSAVRRLLPPPAPVPLERFAAPG